MGCRCINGTADVHMYNYSLSKAYKRSDPSPTGLKVRFRRLLSTVYTCV